MRIFGKVFRVAHCRSQEIALKSGESKKVEIKLDKSAFQYYNPDKKQWVLEPGKFEILVGGSSKDIKLKGSIVIND
jgi:beta-glucosidase